MLRNLENIWSKNLVNSEEVAIFDVPNIYTSVALCNDVTINSQYSGVSQVHISSDVWMFGDIWGGSASPFVKNIINQIFSYLMPNITKDLKPGDNSSLTSTQPSEKGKSQSKLEKEIIAIQKKVSKLQEECRHERNEKYRLLCYIHQYCSALFPYFDRSNPVDSKNWERVHRLQLDLDKEIK